MSTRKEIVDAHVFERRRLVAAFVTGASGGEPDTAGTGRTIVTGLLLAVLVVAGSAAPDLIHEARHPAHRTQVAGSPVRTPGPPAR